MHDDSNSFEVSTRRREEERLLRLLSASATKASRCCADSLRVSDSAVFCASMITVLLHLDRVEVTLVGVVAQYEMTTTVLNNSNAFLLEFFDAV
jgi:hypothetical protein